jgi:beta-xylosidase
MRISILLLLAVILMLERPSSHPRQHPEARNAWVADNGDGTYTNPVIFADYSDPDVIRVDDDFYLVSSSFNCVPGLPVLHSRDLVNWKIIGHVFDALPFPTFDNPQQGKGCWAPSIRYHDAQFWVFYGDPDLGVYMSRARKPEGPWEPLVCIKEAKGWIDPCPLWDDDGNAYLVHAWAKSRAGFNSILTVNRLSPDGRRILDAGVTVFDGHRNQPTIEGPKFYKRNGYYYILAPAGGVATGWQVALRAKNVYGPYEEKVVLHQGATKINGPHQGGWIETQTGESWFVHFQDRGAYGRVVHLQPVAWRNDWPVMGSDPDGDGDGEPVARWKKPDVRRQYAILNPQTSDEFESATLGLQWQWPANPAAGWYSLSAQKGALRLYTVAVPRRAASLWNAPNLLLQKFPAPAFKATTVLKFHPTMAGEKAGLLVMGRDYSYLALVSQADGLRLTKVVCRNADGGGEEEEEAGVRVEDVPISMSIEVDTGAVCQFRYSLDGTRFEQIGKPFQAQAGVWIGAKVGLFSTASGKPEKLGHMDFQWFRVSPAQ